MELEQPGIAFKPVRDRRAHVPEPPPVRLVAVEDVRAQAGAGLETQLDEFYVGLLKFEREGSEQGHLTYKAENFRLHFDTIEPPLTREDFRPIGIDSPSLPLLKEQLNDREVDYLWQRGLLAGHDTIMLKDPAGNWVQIGEFKPI
jgi:hypothetical protein